MTREMRMEAHSLALWPRALLFFALCGVLALAGPTGRWRQPPGPSKDMGPWDSRAPSRKFSDAVSQRLRMYVPTLVYAGNEKEIAKAITEDTYTIPEPETERIGADFGMYFSAVVFKREWPLSYLFILTPGLVRRRVSHYGEIEIFNGLYPATGCQKDRVPARIGSFAALGKFGWPCQYGGSVTVTSETSDGTWLHVMLIFLPSGIDDEVPMGVEDPEKKQKWLETMLGYVETALEHCSRLQLRIWDVSNPVPIDLSTMAVCIFDTHHEVARRPSVRGPTSTASGRARTLKGVAVNPTGSVLGDPPNGWPTFGLSSPEGHVSIHYLPVPAEFGVPLYLYVICALDWQRPYY